MHLLFKNLMKLNVVRNTDDILELFIFTFGIDFSLLINLELTVMLKSDILYMIYDIITYFSAYFCNPYRSNGGNDRLEIIRDNYRV